MSGAARKAPRPRPHPRPAPRRPPPRPSPRRAAAAAAHHDEEVFEDAGRQECGKPVVCLIQPEAMQVARRRLEIVAHAERTALPYAHPSVSPSNPKKFSKWRA